MTEQPHDPDPVPAPGSAGATPYPTHWEADVLTADGSVVRIRPVHPDDTEALRAMHHRMSDHSRYLRYFSAVSEVSDAVLRLFTDVDHVTRVCLVAQSDDDIVAAGSYYADAARPNEAEVAFAVQDDQQRRGLGSILLEHLAAAAQDSCNPQLHRPAEFGQRPACIAEDGAGTEDHQPFAYGRYRCNGCFPQTAGLPQEIPVHRICLNKGPGVGNGRVGAVPSDA